MAKISLRNLLSFAQKRFIQTKATPSSARKPSPLDSALLASKSLQISKVKSPKFLSIFKCLQSHGFDDAGIVKLVKRRPAILNFKVDKNLEPKLQYLGRKGYTGQLLSQLILSNPMILFRSLDDQIKPPFKFMQPFLNDKELFIALKRSSWLLTFDLNTVMQPNVDLLISEGFLLLVFNEMRDLKGQRHSFRDNNYSEDSFRWQRRMFPVYVGNLSDKVTSKQLWEVFSRFSRVVDVFISRKSYKSEKSGITFGFVHYASEDDRRKALHLGDGRILDGKRIKVDLPKKSRSLSKRSETFNKRGSEAKPYYRRRPMKASHKRPSIYPNGFGKVRQKSSHVEKGKTFADAVLNRKHVDALVENQMSTVDSAHIKAQISSSKKEIMLSSFNIDCQWLKCSVIARLREVVNIAIIHESFSKAGYHCEFRILGGMDILVSFEHEDYLDRCLAECTTIINRWFSTFDGWVSTYAPSYCFKRFTFKRFPLHLWDERVFKHIGDKLGIFVSADEDCLLRRCLPELKLLIAVDNSKWIPSTIRLISESTSYEVDVSISDPLNDSLVLGFDFFWRILH